MAYDYLPTDAYYAMDEETREARCRGSNRQYEILCKEQRQLDMKDELSRREKRDYGSEILSYMVESQVSLHHLGNTILTYLASGQDAS